MKRFSKVGAVALAFVLAAGLSVSQGVAADKVLFILDWAHYAGHTGFFNALESGFFNRAGMDVTIQRGYGSGDTIKKIAAKKGDFGAADTGTLVVARNKGAMVKSLGVLYNNAPHSVYALKSSGIDSVKALEGKTYGDAAGGSTAALFPALATLHGVKKWNFVNYAPIAKYAALLSKSVDFICTYADVAEGMKRTAVKRGDELIELRWSDNGLQFHGNGIVAHDDTISQRADLARRFVNAVFQGVADAIGNPPVAVQRFLKNAPALNPDIISKDWKTTMSLAYTPETRKIGVGRLSEKKMKSTIDIVSKYMKIPRRAKVEEIYAPQFLKKHLP